MNCNDENKYLNQEHKIASSSTSRIQYGGTIPLKHAFMWVDGSKAAIFNSSIPYERFFIDGIEVDTVLIRRGARTSGCIYTGQEYTTSYMLAAMMHCGGGPSTDADYLASSCNAYTSDCVAYASNC